MPTVGGWTPLMLAINLTNLERKTDINFTTLIIQHFKKSSK